MTIVNPFNRELVDGIKRLRNEEVELVKQYRNVLKEFQFDGKNEFDGKGKTTGINEFDGKNEFDERGKGKTTDIELVSLSQTVS